ncbi:MAG: quinone-dependent dihydroorotate dehydrogenase, partial [Bdellovibrionaceae bacterium]|nr:quinone-dependent dihydroorotate dehydrogenase [Pseudobdellovibrionaceae bacterium]
LWLIDRLHSEADVFVVNISSPNTSGLRDLQKAQALSPLLGSVVDKSKNQYGKPVLVKLSPDLQAEEFSRSLQTAVSLGVDGFVLTNTTTAREKNSPFPSEGGVSGRPLAPLSKEALKTAISELGSKRNGLLLVSVGGVMTCADVFERLEMGADLVQCYSALVFAGPSFFKKAAQEWKKRSK